MYTVDALFFFENSMDAYVKSEILNRVEVYKICGVVMAPPSQQIAPTLSKGISYIELGVL